MRLHLGHSPAMRGGPALAAAGRSGGFQAFAAVAASAFVAAVLGATDQPALIVGALGGLGLLALGYQRPAAFLLVFLMLRPLLDEFSDNVSIGVPGGNLGGALGLLIIAMLIGLVVTRKGILVPPTGVAFSGIVAVTAGGALVAMADFGGTVGTDPISETVRVLCALCLVILAANVLRSEERLRTIVIVAGLSGVLPALWGLVELPTLQTIPGEEAARISGPFVGPNPLAQYLATTSLILMAMPRDWMSARTRWLALLPQLIAIVPTYSRVGYVMLLVGTTILFWRSHKQVLIGMVVVVAAVVMLVKPVHDRVLPPEQTSTSSQPTYESYDWRVTNWITLLGEWQKQPFVGYGTGTTVFVNPRRPVGQTKQLDGGYEAHNLVVRVLVEGGLALLLVYVAFAIAAAASLRRMARADWDLRPVARLVAILWFLMLLVGLLTDDSFGNTSVLFLLLTLTGALEGTYRVRTMASRSPARQRVAPTSFLPARPRTS